MFPLALAVPEVSKFSSAVLAFLGLKKFSEEKKDFPLFPFTSFVAYGVNKVLKNEGGDTDSGSKWDSYSKNWDSVPKFDDLAIKLKRKNNFDSYSNNFTSYVFNFDDGVIANTDDILKNDNVNDSSDNVRSRDVGFNDFIENYLDKKESGINTFFNEYILELLSFVDKRENFKDLPKFDNLLKNVDIDLQNNADSLLDVLSKNGANTVTVLSSLVNAMSSFTVSNSYIGLQLVNEIQMLRDVLKVIPIAIMSNNKSSELVAVLSELGLVLKDKDVRVENNVENNIDIDSLVNVLDNHLSKVAEAKELEKENYEYMKTPKIYTLSDEELPKLAPRDVIALSEAIKAHLNSQEASLTGEELSDFEDDFDLGDVLTKLFNFKGITEDINKLPKE